MTALAWLIAVAAIVSVCPLMLHYVNEGVFTHEGRKDRNASVPWRAALTALCIAFATNALWPEQGPVSQPLVMPIVILLTCTFVAITVFLGFFFSGSGPRSGPAR